MDIRNKVNLEVDCTNYFQDIESAILSLKLSSAFGCSKFDCIVATKRSGLMMGAYLSNKFNIPMFITSEIPYIPEKFRNVLLVDDKIWRGRQFRKYTRELQRSGKFVCTMCLYLEAEARTDIYVKNVGSKVKLFYER